VLGTTCQKSMGVERIPIHILNLEFVPEHKQGLEVIFHKIALVVVGQSLDFDGSIVRTGCQQERPIRLFHKVGFHTGD